MAIDREIRGANRDADTGNSIQALYRKRSPLNFLK